MYERPTPNNKAADNRNTTLVQGSGPIDRHPDMGVGSGQLFGVMLELMKARAGPFAGRPGPIEDLRLQGVALVGTEVPHQRL